MYNTVDFALYVGVLMQHYDLLLHFIWTLLEIISSPLFGKPFIIITVLLRPYRPTLKQFI